MAMAWLISSLGNPGSRAGKRKSKIGVNNTAPSRASIHAVIQISRATGKK
jgi:hypothetical protein